MSVAIVTDSNSGISVEEGKSLGIFVLPMPVIIDKEIYFEGLNIDESAFYNALKSEQDVSTSQPSPADVMDEWDKILGEGYDGLVYIPMSSGLSGSCATAKALARDYDGKVEVADNHRISVTTRISVLEAKKMADNGESAATIREYLERTGLDSSIFLAVNTLDYLKKGGRISPAAAKIGTMLNIKPILTIQGEKIDAYSMVRGQMDKAEAKMINSISREIITRFADVPREKIYVGGAGAGLNESEKEAWVNRVKEAFPGINVYYDPLSFSVSTHTGPGAVGIGVSSSDIL